MILEIKMPNYNFEIDKLIAERTEREIADIIRKHFSQSKNGRLGSPVQVLDVVVDQEDIHG